MTPATAAPIKHTYFTTTGKCRTITLVKGDIAKVPAQAMLAPINSGGKWFGAIDGVIQRHAGMQFHSQVQLPKRHGDVIVARQKRTHTAQFHDVVFVIDDLEGPLNELLHAGLKGASESGYEDVSLCAFRTGVMRGAYEKTVQLAVNALVRGIQEFYLENSDTQLSSITFVIYDSDVFLVITRAFTLSVGCSDGGMTPGIWRRAEESNPAASEC